MYFATGSYGGDGTDNRTIAGTRMLPQFVLVKGGANHAVMRVSAMQGDSSKRAVKPVPGTDAVLTNAIQQLLPNGFQVGTDARVNALGTTYYWVAAADDALARGNTTIQLKVLTYNGTGSDFSITGVGFRPNVVFVIPLNDAGHVTWRTSLMGGMDSQDLRGSLGSTDIISLDADGFTVSLGSLSTGGVTYAALCLRSTINELATLTWAGDGTDNRSITGAGFQPQFALVKSDGTDVGVVRLRDEAGDASMPLDNSGAEMTNAIQSLTSDGLQIGTDAKVNAFGSTYHALVWASPPVLRRETIRVPDNAQVFVLPGAGLPRTYGSIEGLTYGAIEGMSYGQLETANMLSETLYLPDNSAVFVLGSDE